jgi:uncharacterized protein (TIGR02145 family)
MEVIDTKINIKTNKMKKQTRSKLTILVVLLSIVLYSCEKSDNPIPEQEKENETDIGTITDIDGNTYFTVKIGNQWWMKENLKTTKYNDGTDIQRIDSDSFWAETKKGAYCHYENQENYKDTFGLLYNYYAIESEKLCPEGWRIPTFEDWRTLLNYIDSTLNVENECDALRSYTGWKDVISNLESNGSDLVGFKALPSGYRALRTVDTAAFWGKESWTMFWSETINDDNTHVYALDLSPSNPSHIGEGKFNKISIPKNCGVNIRLIKD